MTILRVWATPTKSDSDDSDRCGRCERLDCHRGASFGDWQCSDGSVHTLHMMRRVLDRVVTLVTMWRDLQGSPAHRTFVMCQHVPCSKQTLVAQWQPAGTCIFRTGLV
jgi:site-specific recombinase